MKAEETAGGKALRSESSISPDAEGRERGVVHWEALRALNREVTASGLVGVGGPQILAAGGASWDKSC